jgi:hypothetical protein
MFLLVAVCALALPLRLSSTKSRRFAGVTPSAQAILVFDAHCGRDGRGRHAVGRSKVIF